MYTCIHCCIYLSLYIYMYIYIYIYVYIYTYIHPETDFFDCLCLSVGFQGGDLFETRGSDFHLGTRLMTTGIEPGTTQFYSLAS